MKTSFLLLFFVLGVGRLAAQSSALNPAVRTNLPPPALEYRLFMVMPQNPYEMRVGRFVYDGLGIELYETGGNPLKLLAPLKQEPPTPTAADRVWEQNKPNPAGLSIFSIKF